VTRQPSDIPLNTWLGKAIRQARRHGLASLLVKTVWFIRRRRDERACRAIIFAPEPAGAVNEAANAEPLISLLVPLYNTPARFLAELLASVRAQTSPAWQLCLADGSDDPASDVREQELLRQAAADARIRYCRLAGNRGISGNSNAAWALADGSYVGLLDHDDCLAPDAIAAVRRAICAQDADLVYSDELSFIGQVRQIHNLHLKPDYAPDNLRSNNYICHLTVFRRTLLGDELPFRPACDGSQDYDLILRLCERARRIVHIPRVLYYWRVHPGSVAADLAVKPYCLAAARLALSEHLQRCGASGTVEDGRELSTYRIRYPVIGQPLVSILLLPDPDQTKHRRRKPADPAGPAARALAGSTAYPAIEVQAAPDLAALGALARGAAGDYLLILDPAFRPTGPDWLAELLSQVQRPEIGAAGPLLLCGGRVDSAGLVLGLDPIALPAWQGVSARASGSHARLSFVNNVSALALDCLLLARADFLDLAADLPRYQSRPALAAELCRRLTERGLNLVMTPHACLRRRGRLKRALARIGPADLLTLCLSRPELASFRDPYYHPLYSRNRADFRCRIPPRTKP
jgi:GT2 family glycosyltransferase